MMKMSIHRSSLRALLIQEGVKPGDILYVRETV